MLAPFVSQVMRALGSDLPSAAYNEIRLCEAGAELRTKPGGVVQRMTRIEIPTTRTDLVRSSEATRRISSGSNNAAPRTSSPRAIGSSPSLNATRRNGQKLPMEWEQEVIDLVKLFSAHYFRLFKRDQIAEMTNAYLQYVRTSTETVSTKWVNGLCNRHPDFGQWYAGRKDTEAGAEANPKGEKKRLHRFLRAWSKCISDNDISRSNTYVVTHTAYALSLDRDVKLLIPHPKKDKRSDSREMASVISGFSCSGACLPPYVIFKREAKSPGSKNHSRNVRTSWNSTGWVNDGGFLFDWVEETFEKETNAERRSGDDAPERLILLDDEKFGISPKFFMFCFSKNIALFSFPRQSGKVFSPLEGAITAVVDGEYSNYMSRKRRQLGERFRIKDPRFTKFQNDCLADSNLEAVARAAWVEACLAPVNAQGLSNLIGRDPNTPAPETWGSPQVRRAVSMPARPIETPQTSDSDSDSDSESSETVGCGEWHLTAPSVASSVNDSSASDECESSSSEEESSDEELTHPVDRDQFRRQLRALSTAKNFAKKRKAEEWLMTFYDETEPMYKAGCDFRMRMTAKTAQAQRIPKTPKSTKRRRSG